MAANSTAAQLGGSLGGPEPFSITTGSSFAASGSTGRGTSLAIRSIAADIREAQAIINGNHALHHQPSSITKSALEGMLHSLDPHSNYHDAAEWKELLNEQNSGYGGIGITIGEFSRAGKTGVYILSTAPGSTASKEQLRFGDRILQVEGRDIAGMSLAAVRDLLRGEPGTSVRFSVQKPEGKIISLRLQRNMIDQPSIPDAYMLRPGIGYIDLTEGFDHSTAGEFELALRDLKRQGMRSLVLDLRGNGGGLVTQAVKVAEKFLPAGTRILTQRGRFPGDTRVYYSENAKPETVPIVILVNRHTASASEIVAGAFQDDDRALIVGEKTYGKALVQTVIDLPGGSGLTLTTARYLTPSGRSIQRDYSTGDLYDYYARKNPGSSTGKAFFEARTVTNRKVFGGDGIEPDESVAPEQVTETQAALLDPIFYFVLDLVSRKSDSQPQLFKGPPAPLPAVGDELIGSCFNYILNFAPDRFSRKLILEESAFIRTHLQYYVTMASHGPTAAARVLAASEPQISRSIKALPRAAHLAELAEQARK